jgi:eukaryotic-like serine/threonine-protein kinase
MDKSTSSSESMQPAQPEARIGSYRVLNALGVGGMSSVFRAVHVETNHEVALKVLTRSLARNSTLLQRFLREARSAETLEHPNIVAIYDRGIDSGRHYLVLEYLAGGDFHDYILRRGPLSLAEAIRVVKSTAEGLKYAANRGLIHRDVKPSNILRTPDGKIKIIDLGLALQHEFEDERVTRDGTTVGTVDYMAPEQARDSRATSIQSDMYSLGCTFYFLLTGVPPFPGGDITDKLTRHAKNPPPDVRDLRPDLPGELSALLLKMMAKRPEDRFATYDELISAIDWIPLAGANRAPAVTLAPVYETEGAAPQGYDLDATRIHKRDEPHSNGSAGASLPLVSLAELAAEDHPRSTRDQLGAGSSNRDRSVIERHGLHMEDIAEADVSELPDRTASAPSGVSIPVMAFIIPGAILCLAFVILGIGLAQFMGSQDGAEADDGDGEGFFAGAPLDRAAGGAGRGFASAERRGDASERSRTLQPGNGRAAAPSLADWVEPPDLDPRDGASEQGKLPAAVAEKYLPEWARAAVPEHIDGPLLTVQRIATSSEASVVPSLQRGLEGQSGGTVELADEGPHVAADFGFSGEARMIRARKGIRPIVRIDRATGDTARKQPAVFAVNGKRLTLDGIDLIVDARDLSRTQTALFLCSGGNLTLRNCSITILNHAAGIPLSLIRTEADATRRPSLIRLEGCLVRGGFTEGFRLGGGPCDVVLRDSTVAARGGPLVRYDGADAAPESRVFLVQSLVAGPGPIFESTATAIAGTSKPGVIRAWGSVLGRLHGESVASVIAANNSDQPPEKLFDWSGAENLFAGWKGFFACGVDRTVIIAGLSEARSTWNGTDLSSREILAPWGYLGDLASARAADFSGFASSHAAILEHAARPRAGLYEKAVARYDDPVVPEPAEWTPQADNGPRMMNKPNSPVSHPAQITGVRRNGSAPAPGSTAALELTFNTWEAPWGGDLGAFLHDNLLPSFRFVRVQVKGSGEHVFTPVKLPRGIRLEIRVETTSRVGAPSWSPAEGATGTALVELEGGALVISNLMLRHAKTSKLEHLIDVKDAHLVLSNCQLNAGMSANSNGDLIAFRAASTQPRPVYVDEPLFSFATDRPVCRLRSCVLVTGGRALEAEVGRGLLALSQCGVAAGGTAIELKPANVARCRFDADLVLDRCTLAAERAIVHAVDWAGLAPGPDRPWLITSRHCAFLDTGTRETRNTVLLQCDGDSLADGSVFWQGDDDAAEVEWFISASADPLPANRARDVQQQWVQFWGPNHMGRVTGPRATGNRPSVRFRDRRRSGQEIEPADLILDPLYHPDRPELSVGADLSRTGSIPMAAPARPGLTVPAPQRSTVPF